jgi:cytochrome c553
MKILKWLSVIVLAVIVIAAASAFFLSSRASSRLSQKYQIEPSAIALPSDSASIAAGSHWAIGCRECHGNDLEGKFFFEAPGMATMYAPNITAGKGGKTGNYTELDWIRAIRHGVRPDGTPLFVMPSKDYHHMSLEDLGELIAYLKTIPAVDNEVPDPKYEFMGKVMLGAGMFGPEVISAEVVDHMAGYEEAPLPGPTQSYGDYLVKVTGCRTCHGKELNGFKDGDPNSPVAPNITPGGNLANWPVEAFMKTLRTGVTPEGKTLDAKFMPFLAYGNLYDDEIAAIYLYLKSLPALEDAVK